MRILVIEDDKDVAGFVVKGLKEAGHVVEHADHHTGAPLLLGAAAFYGKFHCDPSSPACRIVRVTGRAAHYRQNHSKKSKIFPAS